MRRWAAPAGAGSCRCGMGLATGEAELRGADYFRCGAESCGRGVNGPPGMAGQILVAESTAGLLSGVDLLDFGGQRRFAGICPTAGRGLFQVPSGRAWPADFPALRALGASPGNLAGCDPPASIGRESEGRRAARRGEGSSVGHAWTRGGRGSARPAWRWKSRRGWADEFSRRGFGFSSWAAVTDPRGGT